MAFNNRRLRTNTHRSLHFTYQVSLASLAFLLRRPSGASALTVLTGFRAVLAAQLALLLHEKREHDEDTVAAIRWELERIDRELALCDATINNTN